MPAVVFENLDIVFGKRVREALALIDQGKTRDEIIAATGAVLGAAGVNLAMGFEAGLAIVILAIILDRVCKQPEVPAKRG